MWIPILIIIFVVAMAVGPIMWFRSTPSQRRVVECRKRAAELGMRVHLTPLSELKLPGEEDSTEPVAGYCLPWLASVGSEDRLSRAGSQPWRLVRQRISHESHFAGWWNWQKGREAGAQWHASLRKVLPNLPADVLALESDRRGLCVYWWEKGGRERVEQLAAMLQGLQREGTLMENPPRD